LTRKRERYHMLEKDMEEWPEGKERLPSAITAVEGSERGEGVSHFWHASGKARRIGAPPGSPVQSG